MIALIDADSLLYKCCCVIEDKVIWNENEIDIGAEEEAVVIYSTELEALYTMFDKEIEKILFATCCDKAKVVLSGKDNFRFKIPTPYKTNRASLRKPEGFQELRNYVIKKYKVKVIDFLEADDIVVYEKTTYPDDYVLCAIDKDVIYQTVGTHYHYNDDVEITVDEYEAIRFPYFQCLVGDVTDGYIGCKGIGKVKANKLFEEIDKEKDLSKLDKLYWEAVVSGYESKGFTEEDAINTMRLANMHQYNGKEIILWKPEGV